MKTRSGNQPVILLHMARRPDGTVPPSMPPGGSLRFAVRGPEGTFSLSYKVTSSKNSADFYPAGRHARGIEKVSFHASGSWSHSIPSERESTVQRNFESRHMDIWTEPDAFFEGWRRAYFICTPRTELREGHGKYLHRDTVVVPDPGAGNWAIINLFVARDVTAQLPLRNYYEIGRLKLVDDSTVVLVGHTFRPNAPTSRYLAAQRDAMMDDIVTDAQLREVYENHPEFFSSINIHLHGTRGQIDLSFSEQPASLRTICLCDDVRLREARALADRP